MKPLPSYWLFARFINQIVNQVVTLAELRIIGTSFIGLDSMSVAANTSQTISSRSVEDSLRK